MGLSENGVYPPNDKFNAGLFLWLSTEIGGSLGLHRYDAAAAGGWSGEAPIFRQTPTSRAHGKPNNKDTTNFL